jgi:hypothetical protein
MLSGHSQEDENQMEGCGLLEELVCCTVTRLGRERSQPLMFGLARCGLRAWMSVQLCGSSFDGRFRKVFQLLQRLIEPRSITEGKRRTRKVPSFSGHDIANFGFVDIIIYPRRVEKKLGI